MKVTEYRYGEDVKDEDRTYQEVKTINSMVPLWVKAKKDVTQEEYDSFYRTTFHDGEAPLLTIHTSVEGKVDYKALGSVKHYYNAISDYNKKLIKDQPVPDLYTGDNPNIQPFHYKGNPDD